MCPDKEILVVIVFPCHTHKCFMSRYVTTVAKEVSEAVGYHIHLHEQLSLKPCHPRLHSKSTRMPAHLER